MDESCKLIASIKWPECVKLQLLQEIVKSINKGICGLFMMDGCKKLRKNSRNTAVMSKYSLLFF